MHILTCINYNPKTALIAKNNYGVMSDKIPNLKVIWQSYANDNLFIQLILLHRSYNVLLLLTFFVLVHFKFIFYMILRVKA